MKTLTVPVTVLLSVLAVTMVLSLAGCPSGSDPSSAAALAPGSDAGAEGEELTGTIRISGAWALYPMMMRWCEEFCAQHPGVTTDVSAGGAGKGAADALSGMVDIGMISRAIHPEEEAKGGWWVPVAKDAVFPVINVDNPVLDELRRKGVKVETLVGIWVDGKITTWGQVAGTAARDEIHLFTRSDACGAAETWAKFLGAAQEDLLGTAVYGDPGLAEAVRADRLGLGFNNLNYAFDPDTGRPVAGLCVLPLDLNGDGTLSADEDFYGSEAEVLAAVGDGRYPSPPARTQHLLCKGAPSGVTAEFIRWILTEGQALAPEAGYVPLTPAQAQEALAKLK